MANHRKCRRSLSSAPMRILPWCRSCSETPWQTMTRRLPCFHWPRWKDVRGAARSSDARDNFSSGWTDNMHRLFTLIVREFWMTTAEKKVKKVKISHTCYRALGPELIPCTGCPQVVLSHPPGGRLLLLSARPAVTFPAEERHHP